MDHIDRDPYNSNPYAPPEAMYAGPVPATLRHSRIPLFGWLGLVVVIETAMTWIMVHFHGDSPRIHGLNVFALAQLMISGMLASGVSWRFGRLYLQLKSHAAAQSANLLVWCTLIVTLYRTFPGDMFIRSELWIFASACCLSAVLCLAATFLSGRVFRDGRQVSAIDWTRLDGAS